MGRWQPNARGRLQEAALELFLEHGFEQTTVAEIAERAGLTERTFFRHFADKREVLFDGAAALTEVLVSAVAHAGEQATPFEAAAEGVVEPVRRFRTVVTSPVNARGSSLPTQSCRNRIDQTGVDGDGVGGRPASPRCPGSNGEPRRRSGDRRLPDRLRALVGGTQGRRLSQVIGESVQQLETLTGASGHVSTTPAEQKTAPRPRPPLADGRRPSGPGNGIRRQAVISITAM